MLSTEKQPKSEPKKIEEKKKKIRLFRDPYVLIEE